MHPAQKKAVFGMIDSIENQLRYVKSMLMMDEAAEVGHRTSMPQPQQTKEPVYVTEDEEEEIGRRMEEERLKMLRKEGAEIEKNWAAQREIVADGGSFI